MYRDDDVEEFDRLIVDNRRRQIIAGARYIDTPTQLYLVFELPGWLRPEEGEGIEPPPSHCSDPSIVHV